MGSMARGKRSMLKREMAVKAFCASKILSGLADTKTAKVASDTCKTHISQQLKQSESYALPSKLSVGSLGNSALLDYYEH